MESFFEIRLDQAPKGSRKAAATLYQQLKTAIADGRLAAGSRLPPTRRAATIYGVSRSTAVAVYERLLADGYVVGFHGSGTFVAEMLHAAEPAATAVTSPDMRLNTFWLSSTIAASIGFWREPSSSPPDPGRRLQGEGTIDFRPAIIDTKLFPFDAFRRCCAKGLRAMERRPARFASPQGNQGNFQLRTAIASHIAVTRAVTCRPSDIVVTAGAQQAFDLLARILVTANQTVVTVEDPGYPPMRVAFAAAGARLVPVPVDDEGMIVEQLPPEAGIILACPSHQFPLGVPMSPPRRRALIAHARRHGAVIVEDDYDGEFRYAGSPLEALRTASNADVVCYVGTFSKCMLPALRLGFVVVPPWAFTTLVAAKNCADWHCAIPLQAAVAGFIADGSLTRHVRRMRALYRGRRESLLAQLQSSLGDWLEPLPSYYGMHVTALTRRPLDAEAVSAALRDKGVHLHALGRYYLEAPKHTGFVFGYGATHEAQIAQGLSTLHASLTAT